MPDISFETALESALWTDEKAVRRIVRQVTSALDGQLPKDTKGHIAFVFSDDSMVQVLNREWRGKDKPTNVLSFPDGDEMEEGLIHLGDVIVAHETLAREAAKLGISFDHHLTHLLLHGSLHLLGHDHMTDEEAKIMETLETKLLADMGIKDPYQDGFPPLD